MNLFTSYIEKLQFLAPNKKDLERILSTTITDYYLFDLNQKYLHSLTNKNTYNISEVMPWNYIYIKEYFGHVFYIDQYTRTWFLIHQRFVSNKPIEPAVIQPEVSYMTKEYIIDVIKNRYSRSTNFVDGFWTRNID